MSVETKAISRRFAVMQPGGRVVFIYLTKSASSGQELLQVKSVRHGFESDDEDRVKKLLVEAGLTVRFYDSEEKTWVDWSLQDGVIPAPGQKDGTWGMPGIDGFKRDYLRR